MMKTTKKQNEYLFKVFQLMKRREGLVVTDRKTHFNNTEMRMISELLAARYEGRRLISSQLAKMIGVTRSAVSQIVNKLEEEGVIVRIPSDKDKKIAYVELTDKTLETYREDIATCTAFVGSLVKELVEDNFEKMCVLFNAFIDLAEAKIKK